MVKKPPFWVICIAGILYLVFNTYIAYYYSIDAAYVLSVPIFIIFAILGIDIFKSVTKKEVFKTLAIIYLLVVILYYSFNKNALYNFSIKSLLGLILFFISIMFVSAIFYFIPSAILEYWQNKNGRKMANQKNNKNKE